MVTSKFDWGQLKFDSYSPQQVHWAVNDVQWQAFRTEMVGESLERKYELLRSYLRARKYDMKARIQVTNYVNALKRGGLIR